MVNILDLMKSQLGNAAMGKVAEMIGDSAGNTSSAMGSVLPALIGGLISKGSTKEGASGMMDFMKDQKLDGGMFDDLTGFLGDGNKTSSLMKIGGLALPFILGGKKAGFMNLISKATGMGSGKMGSLLSIAAPMVMGMISKQMTKSGGGVSGLMDLLNGQKAHIKNELPAGFGDMLGFAAPAAPSTPEVTGNASGSGLLKWLIPLLAVLAGVWFFTKDGCSTAAVDKTEDTATSMSTQETKPAASETTMTSGTATSEVKEAAETVSTDAKVITTTDGVGANGAILSIDADGNLVNRQGVIVARAGQFKTVEGTYFDMDGKRLGGIADVPKMDDAKSTQTMDFFKVKFDEFLTKKSETNAYTLSQMKFNPDNQRISFYSKPEFEGLAAALKSRTDDKIVVQVHTADGKNEKENKKLSGMRAAQIQSMLQTLGVKGAQMSFKGMGSGDAAKAGKNAIEIKIK